MRYLSLEVREHDDLRTNLESDLVEDDIVEDLDDARPLVVVICRSRQRLLQYAWNKWCRILAAVHDYTYDVRKILSRFLPDNELRTELEVEVIHKWAVQTHVIDPTGISHLLVSCRRKSIIVNTIQSCRLERYQPGETVLCQGDIPRSDDGHFTVLSGECELLQFPNDSRALQKLVSLSKGKDKEGVRNLLTKAKILQRLKPPSGFGELSTSMKIKRTSSVRASLLVSASKSVLSFGSASRDFSSVEAANILELIIIPQKILVDCLDAKQYFVDEPSSNGNRGVSNSSSEYIDYLRLSGLARGAGQRDVLDVAANMNKRTLSRGDILYRKV